MTDITSDMIVADRERRKLSRAKYAALVGLTPAKIHNLEHGRAPKPDEAEKLRAVIGNDTVQLAPVPESAYPLGAELLNPEQYVHSLKLQHGNENITHCDRRNMPQVTAFHSRITCPDCLARYAGPTEPEDDAAVIEVDVIWDEESWDDDAEYFITVGPEGAAQPQSEVAVSIGARLVSNSEVQTFKRCRRKWWLGWVRHLRLQHESPIGARAVGNWVHHALSQYYVPQGVEPVKPIDALEAHLLEVHNEMQRVLAERAETADDGGIGAEAVMQMFKKDADLARAMIEGYEQWIAETGADQGLEVIGSEEYVEADVLGAVTHEEKPVKAIGKLDLRVHRTFDDVRLFMDHKTVGSLTAPLKTISQNEQMLHYLWLERSQDDERRAAGALYNMLRKVKRTEQANPPFYQRVEVRINEHELESYERHLRGVVAQMLYAEERLADGVDHQIIAYPSPTRDCSWDCDFLPVCGILDDGSRAEDMISQLYRVGEHLDYYRLVSVEKHDDLTR